MSTAASAEYQDALSAAAAADESGTPLPLRSDTFLGVFEAIGQDFGFNPNWLRVPFAALILWNPVVIIGSYLALGVLVALARWLFPAEAPKAAPYPAGDSEPANKPKKDEELAIAA